jgi:uncharacterized protein (TIGR00369 family)
MTMTESVDLFSPTLRRQRRTGRRRGRWPKRRPACPDWRPCARSATVSCRRHRWPRLIGFEMRVADPGRIVMELDPDESLENTIGLLHGATAAALLDAAMGCAISTMLPVGQASVTLDFKLTYLRPLSIKSGTISAEGKVVKLGRQTSYVEGFVHDGAGNLAVHATATFSMIGDSGKAK